MKYWLKETLRHDLETISNKVNYDEMAIAWRSKTAFENDIKKHKTGNFGPVGETMDRMKALLTEDQKTELNEDVLSQIRAEKTTLLESAINVDRIKIFLPKSWTLEYEIAGSKLYRLLATAIKAAQKEESNPEQSITDEMIMELWNEVKTEYPDGHEPTKAEAYKIFKPLNESFVSKAITAQYLAGMFLGELPPVSNGVVTKDELKEIVMTDEKFNYLVKAIEHVTQ